MDARLAAADRLGLRIRPCDPFCFAQLATGSQNTYVAEKHIPGAALIAALHRRIEAEPDRFKALAAALGKLAVSHARPVIQGAGIRSVAVPLSLVQVQDRFLDVSAIQPGTIGGEVPAFCIDWKDHDWNAVQARLLRTESALHCGDGEELPARGWDGLLPLGNAGHINTVCTGHLGAYIPASTLRGSLRERCAAPLRLFGEARGAAGHAGAVCAYDAVRAEPDPSTPNAKVSGPDGDLYWSRARRTTLRNGVALDAVTGTAEDGKLFTFEAVPPVRSSCACWRRTGSPRPSLPNC